MRIIMWLALLGAALVGGAVGLGHTTVGLFTVVVLLAIAAMANAERRSRLRRSCPYCGHDLILEIGVDTATKGAMVAHVMCTNPDCEYEAVRS